MKFLPFSCVVFILLSNGINGAKLPEIYHRCKVSAATDYKPNRCLVEAIQHAIQYLSESGDRDLGLPDLDPLRINEIAIKQGNNNAAVALEMAFKNFDLFGLKAFKTKSITGKLSSPKDFQFTLEGTLDTMTLVGQYYMNGKMFVLPIKGSGPCNLTLEGMHIKSTIKGEPITKNGHEYLKIKEFKISNDVSKARVYFDNLFGDKALGANMNKFMNENWNELYQEMRGPIEDAVSKLFGIYAKRVLERIQFKNIFIVE